VLAGRRGRDRRSTRQLPLAPPRAWLTTRQNSSFRTSPKTQLFFRSTGLQCQAGDERRLTSARGSGSALLRIGSPAS
jgi:hypothetical protein